MVEYFQLVTAELLLKLAQIKDFIKKHGQTIGIVTEEILKVFLKTHLPKSISVEQGFIMGENGELSKQCDILIYDSHNYAPFYRINDIVIVPYKSVIAVIEVKTTITKNIFHSAIEYFANIQKVTECKAKTYLFIYNSLDVNHIENFLLTYVDENGSKGFDHDTFQLLPDEIIGINESYHLKKDYVDKEGDSAGYSSYFYDSKEGTEIGALQTFYLSVYSSINERNNAKFDSTQAYQEQKKLKSYKAINLFNI
jgi:hypothetical protein